MSADKERLTKLYLAELRRSEVLMVAAQVAAEIAFYYGNGSEQALAKRAVMIAEAVLDEIARACPVKTTTSCGTKELTRKKRRP